MAGRLSRHLPPNRHRATFRTDGPGSMHGRNGCRNQAFRSE